MKGQDRFEHSLLSFEETYLYRVQNQQLLDSVMGHNANYDIKKEIVLAAEPEN